MCRSVVSRVLWMVSGKRSLLAQVEHNISHNVMVPKYSTIQKFDVGRLTKASFI